MVKKHHRALAPMRPPLKLLARGGHTLLLCIGTSHGQELRLGAEHFVKPLRAAHNLQKGVDPAAVVVISPVAPTDWYIVAEYREVYFLQGNPLSPFDLERANFSWATHIFVCHAGHASGAKVSEPWMVDAEVICCTRQIEAQLGAKSTCTVIAELACDLNHPYLPLPGLSAPKTRAEEEVLLIRV